MNNSSPATDKQSVVEIRDVSMAYKLYKRPIDMLKETIFGGIRHDTFWAVRDVSLSVHEGERLGIIGHNGAGKSTLLQMIAGNLTPTRGSVIVNGRISSLLSMTPAWNGEESGLENIKFNLLVQGVKPAAISSLVEDIIDFTDLGPFIYQPVKTYSSGMSARLSFAIATAVDPEILIVDEVLGAGDGYFAGRAARRMQKMCDRGKALLFVSHSTGAVRMMCDTCVWIENGQVRLKGPVETVVRQYEEDVLRQQDESMREGNRRRLAAQHRIVTPEEIGEEGLFRLRIRPVRDDPRITETHYVRNIVVSIGQDRFEVPIGVVDIRRDDTRASLDLHSCEWGRISERHGIECRALLPRTGVRKGGHILFKLPEQAAANVQSIEVSLEVSSEGSGEALTIDYVDLESVEWRRMETIVAKRIDKEWTRIEVKGIIAAPISPTTRAARSELEQIAVPNESNGAVAVNDPTTLDGPREIDSPGVAVRKMAVGMAIARARTLVQSPVTISEVALEVDGRRALSVNELQPFLIRVSLEHHEPLAAVSVNLNIIRSDGAYVFYQPSGLDDRNIVNFRGRSEVRFRFDPNPFGCGDYEANVFATNGFSWQNIPPSEIFDRSVGNLVFRVNLARPISFGLINLIVPVSIDLSTSQTDASLQGDTAPRVTHGF
jgi:lipopolysaccharide transport system ATP-binding protein